MTKSDEQAITDAVLMALEPTSDPRMKQMLTALVRHLHAYASEVEPTFDEWLAAIMFLTRAGQISVNGRQELILLSDILGLSMLVDAINNRLPCGATPSTVMGPFYLQGQPVVPSGSDLTGGAQGTPLFVQARFLSIDGSPLPDTVVDVWQSDEDGFYDVQRPELGRSRLRGRFVTGEEGSIHFWTVMPTSYPIPYDGPAGDLLRASNRSPWRPAHLHFMAVRPGYDPLITHIFVAGDSCLVSDPVFGVKDSLVDSFPEQPASHPAPDGRVLDGPWRSLAYEFRLSEESNRSKTFQL